jgi:predicted DsbA family dithiol-disulfide isomerase
VAPLPLTLFTDPFCPWSWAAEPLRRRLEVEFGAEVALSYVIAGAYREIDGPALALEALDAASASGMPVDVRVFLRHPPVSSHPAGLALHAAAEQGPVGPYLRRIREAVLLEGRAMDSAPALIDAAREAGGLDLERLRLAFGSSAVLEHFGADVERARGVPLPLLEVPDAAGGPPRRIGGREGYEGWRAAVAAAGAVPSGDRPGIDAALRRFGPLATPEIAAVCDLPGPRAAAELWRAALEWRVTPGPLWAPA